MKMQTFRKPHQWLTFWLEKYIEVLTNLKIDVEKRKKYWTILKGFLEALPGNPRNLSLADVHGYIAADAEERLEPITLFFQHIAPSRPHLDMLKKFNAASSGVAAETTSGNDNLDLFVASLQKQDLTDRTIKNYCNAINSYFKWAEENESDRASPRIDAYCAFLTDIRQLAPRTIATHQIALKLYFADSPGHSAVSTPQ